MDNAHQTQMQPTSLRAICQSGALHLLESYTAKRYALNMNFFASINPKLFEELKSPPAQYNVYCNGEDLSGRHRECRWRGAGSGLAHSRHDERGHDSGWNEGNGRGDSREHRSIGKFSILFSCK